MNRRQFIKTAAVCAASSVAAPETLVAAQKAKGKTVRGKVVENKGPVVGVVVSDGLNCVRTDEKGEFELPYRAGARFVSVTVPSGYRCADFYSPISPRGDSHYFWLTPWKPSAGKGCKFVHIADAEIGGMHDTDWMEDIKRVAEKDDAAFIVHTGDICRYRGMRSQLLTMNSATMGRPVVYCLGNHDMTPGPAGETAFEQFFGPCWRSFEAGGVHFVVTPMPMGDHKPSYTMDEVADWVKNDLSMIPKGMPVVFFNHMLTNYEDVSLKTTGFTIGKKHFDIAKACNFTGFVYGHVHVNYFRRQGKTALICSAPPRMGGIALQPATLRTVRADENGRLDSVIRYGTPDELKLSSAGAKWEAKLPGKVLFCTPVVEGGRVFVGTSDDEGCGNAAVVALDAQSGKTLWSQPMKNSVNNKMVFAAGLLIAQDVEGNVCAMRPHDGKIVWKFEREAHPWTLRLNGLALGEKGDVVYSGMGAGMVAIETKSGRVIWNGAGWEGPREACADTAGVGQGRIVSSGNWQGMYCNDAKSGKLLWSVIDGTRRFPGTTPLVEDGKIYTLAASSFLEIDLESGKTLREKRLNGGVQVTTRVLKTNRHFIFGTVKEGLVALDRETLDVAWRGKVGSAIAPFAAYSKKPQRCVGTVPVLLPGGVVCAAASDGAVHFWSEADGKHLKEFRTGAPYFADAVLKDGNIYVADAAGYVRCFKA